MGVKVLYIMGRGRGGSTILANVLGELEGFFSVGEVRYLWDPVLAHNASCACGQVLADCPVWSQVLAWLADIDPDEVARWQRDVVRERNTYRLLRYARDGTWELLEAYAVVMARVYRAVADATAASVIVDSSKRPSYAALVRLLPECDPHYVHLVRDPRASAYSWRHRTHASVYGEGEEVLRRNALDSTLRWDVLNFEAEAVLRRVPKDRVTRVRYEDFVAAPRAVTAQIAEFVGENPEPSPFVDERAVVLRPNHMVAGNPSRLVAGKLLIEDGGEWRTHQSALDRWISTAIAVPYLHRYGYPLFS